MLALDTAWGCSGMATILGAGGNSYRASQGVLAGPKECKRSPRAAEPLTEVLEMATFETLLPT